MKRGLVGAACVAALLLSFHSAYGQSLSGPPLPPGYLEWWESLNSQDTNGATTSSLPFPGEGGGEGGGGESLSYPPPYSTAGLNITIPVIQTNNQLYLTIFDNSTNGNTFTNFNYDIYGRTKFDFHYRWHELVKGDVGQTNFYVPNPTPTNLFYVALLGTDSDSDGLTDGFESFVTKTLTNTNDSDGDGISDFNEWRIGANPTNSAGLVSDTNGIIKLRGHTRLK